MEAKWKWLSQTHNGSVRANSLLYGSAASSLFSSNFQEASKKKKNLILVQFLINTSLLQTATWGSKHALTNNKADDINNNTSNNSNNRSVDDNTNKNMYQQ